MLVRICFVAVTSLVLLVPFVLPHQAHAQVPNVGAPSSCPNLYRDLAVPMVGNDVHELQQFLVARGHMTQTDMNSGPGIFGPRTKLAVQRFQSNYGVPATGYVGPLTRAAIARVCGQGTGGGTLPLGVSMSASPVSGTAPLTVAFVVTAQASPCSSYILDFGDGQSEVLSSFCGTRTIPHTYPTQGTLNAHLDELLGGQRIQRAQSSISVGAAVVPAPTCTIAATKISITPNEPTTITWSSTNATSAKWQDGISTGTSGSALFSNIATTTTKSITFTGSGGTKQCSITITVTAPKTGSIVASGNAIANGATIALPASGQSAFKLAEFTLTAGSYEPVFLKKFVFTLRNQTGNNAPGAATVQNYRVTIGTNSYTVSVTKSGVYETGTVSLPSGLPAAGAAQAGVTLAAGQGLGIGIFADVVPNSGGNIDLWVYPADMEFMGVTSNLPIIPTSSVTNRVDTTLLYWSGWVSVGTGSGGGTISGDCIMNGKGYALNTAYGGDGTVYPDYGPGGGGEANSVHNCSPFSDLTPKPECKLPPAGSIICRASGWVGDYGTIIPGVKVACWSRNGIFKPGGRRAQGYACIWEDNSPECTNGMDHIIHYLCKRDGWWETDSAGNELRKLDRPPKIDY